MIRVFLSLLFVTSLFVSIPTHAQIFKGGFLLGITGSQMDGDQMTGYNKLGIAAGFFIRHDFSEKIAIQTDCKYLMKGAATFISDNKNGGYRQTLHYVEVPLLSIFKIARKIECEAGLAAAMLLFDTNYIVGDGVYENNNIGKYDFSTVFGVSYLYTERLNVNLKLSNSVKAVSHKYPTNATLWAMKGQFNNVLELSVYYKLK
jgi:hypothetical protein